MKKLISFFLLINLNLILILSCDEIIEDDSIEKPFNPQTSFSIIVLPDTQHYMKYGDDMFNSQISWIIDNKEEENILFVAHLGDMIDNNSSDNSEWIIFTQHIDRLWARTDVNNRIVPYAVVPGNHDYANGRNSDMLNEYMPLSIFQSMFSFGGAFESDKSDNTYHTINAAGKLWLILMLEFGPRNEVLEWANEVVFNHTDHNVIIVTHGYMNESDIVLARDDYRSPTNGYGLGVNANCGTEIWDKLISKHANIFLLVSGHNGTGIDGAAYTVSNGLGNHPVYQMMVNFQRFNYHNNYLRILKFNVTEGEIEVKTYSPEQDNYIENTAESQYQFIIKNISF